MHTNARNRMDIYRKGTSIRYAFTFLLLMGAAGSVRGQQAIVDQFEVRSHTFEALTLPYRLFVPANYDSTMSYPLVLALHGAGERGADNERHIRPHRLATSWADPDNQSRYPSFVVAPQVPSGARWTADAPVDESAFNAVQLTTLDLLDSLQAEFNIDLDRVYVTGLSMGGHGAWDFISRLPGRFAAAVPMSGNADPTQAERILHIPIWAFHGESDTVVPASGSRGIVFAMENLGRDVVYTDCRRSLPLATNFDCPGTLPNAELADLIEDHADMIFTSTRGGGHGPWTVWYDHPLLMDWLYSKHRVDPNALQITGPERGAVEGETVDLTWEYAGAPSDSVEVWLSTDNGASWENVARIINGAGAYQLDVSGFEDTAFARVRLIVMNRENFVYGRAESDPFTINMEGNGLPFLHIDDEDIRFSDVITQRELSIRVLAADPEGDDLPARVYYSIDGGMTFTAIQELTLPSTLDVQEISVDLEALPNASRATVRVNVSDGEQEIAAETAPFVKQNARESNEYVEHIEGSGAGDVVLHFIDPAALTGHRYRITFDDSDPAAKTYSVVDLTTGEVVLSDIPLSDGVVESPLFDGMRIVVQDLQEGMADLEKTGWTIGASNLGITISGGSTVLALQTVPLLETEKEYEIVFSASVVDTSLALFALPAQEMQFYVREANTETRVPVLYRDLVGDGAPSSQDVLYLLEETEPNVFSPAWDIRFSSNSQTDFPEAGDVYRFVPLKKLSREDVFEFVAAVGVNVKEETPGPGAGIQAAYPNPFTHRFTVWYELAAPGRVQLELFDVLGRLVGRQAEESLGPGRHRLTWENEAGVYLANGVYMVRVTTRYPDGTRSRAFTPLIRLAD